MANVALQNFFDGLKRGYESARKTRVDDADLEKEFGINAHAIREMLAGRTPERDARSMILSSVEALGGDDEDASSALILAMLSPQRSDEAETVILNDRLLTRLQNLERYIRRIGKLDEFHDWLAGGAAD